MQFSEKLILLIDDDPELRVLVRRVLENVGCQVIEAAGVKEGIQQIQTRIPDLVILDLNMPEISGFTFLNFRKQNKLLSSLPVLVLSGADDKETIDQALALGAAHFLEKPFRANLVLQKIRQIFLSTESFTYKIPTGDVVEHSATVPAKIIKRNDYQLRFEASVRFETNAPVSVNIDALENTDLKTVTCKVENKLVEIADGAYRQTCSLVGMTESQKESFETWKKRLQKQKKSNH